MFTIIFHNRFTQLSFTIICQSYSLTAILTISFSHHFFTTMQIGNHLERLARAGLGRTGFVAASAPRGALSSHAARAVCATGVLLPPRGACPPCTIFVEFLRGYGAAAGWKWHRTSGSMAVDGSSWAAKGRGLACGLPAGAAPKARELSASLPCGSLEMRRSPPFHQQARRATADCSSAH